MRCKWICLPLLIILSGCSHHRTVQVPNEADSKRSREIAFEEALKKSRQRIKIVIDAGHGGEDFGCHSQSGTKLHEKHLTLTLANMVERYLNYQGYTIVMTRTDDTFIPLKKRSQIANDDKVDLFVSVHFNSASNKKAEGIEVFYYKTEQSSKRSERSKEIATLVLDQLIVHTQAKSRGVKHGNFSVIRETKMPAILVEAGFLTNEAEMEKIRNTSYMQNLAQAIAKGVHEYLLSS